jgi:nucleoside-diphosphate-sugar epimerase
VTGCTGYVGSHLIPLLRDRVPNGRIFGASRGLPAPDTARLLDEHVCLDLTNEQGVCKAITVLQPDLVIHLASPRFGSLAELLRTNVAGLDNLLRAVRCQSVPTLTVVIGSAAEIGRCLPEELPLRETAVCRPVDDYGIAKHAQSLLSQAAYLRFGQAVIRVRLFNLLGPGLPETLLPGRCVRLMAENANVPGSARLAFRNLTARRDYTDVRDACAAITLAARHGVPGKLYHIGSGRSLSGIEIVRGLAAAAGAVTDGIEQEVTPGDPPLVPDQRSESMLASRELGWRPQVTLTQSFEDMWRWVQNGSRNDDQPG